MAESGKKGFRTVTETDEEDFEQKLRKHRRKIVGRTVFIILVLVVTVTGSWLYLSLRHYAEYDIISTVEREDSAATKYAEFQGNLLKYSNDGATYTDLSNERIWTQAFELANPQIDICGDYLTIYDKGGTMIYILSPAGLLGSVETTMPVAQVSIASQGTIGVLMQKDKAGYLAVYDRTGEALAQGAIHGEKGGYPVAIALSKDGVKLAVSMLDINDGNLKSTVAFYNFGSVGQNVTDHCVGITTFPDMVIPEMEFVADDRMVAFSDTEMLVFEGMQKPQLALELPFEQEIKSIFYNEEYVGIVYSNQDEAVTHHMKIYDTKGKLRMETDFSLEYDSVSFLSNGEICVANETACDLYTVGGVYRFHYEFENILHCIIPGKMGLNYSFVMDNETQKVRLK